MLTVFCIYAILVYFKLLVVPMVLHPTVSIYKHARQHQCVNELWRTKLHINNKVSKEAGTRLSVAKQLAQVVSPNKQNQKQTLVTNPFAVLLLMRCIDTNKNMAVAAEEEFSSKINLIPKKMIPTTFPDPIIIQIQVQN